MRAPLLAASILLTAAAASHADEAVNRPPTGEEQRMIALVLKAEGFAPCTDIALVAGRWACRAKNAQGEAFQISLSNVDFAVIARQRVE